MLDSNIAHKNSKQKVVNLDIDSTVVALSFESSHKNVIFMTY